MNILLIDDDELMRNGLKALLERRGHTVCLYTTGEGAIEYALKLCPDITLTDHNLGLCDTGLIIAGALIAENRKAVLMSGDPTIASAALDAGVPFIPKTEIHEIIETLEGARHTPTGGPRRDT